MQCTRCGAVGSGRYCSECGALLSMSRDEGRYWQDESLSAPPSPPPARGGSVPRWLLAGAAAIIVLAVAGLVAVLATSPSRRVEADRPPGSAPVTTTTTAQGAASPTASSEISTDASDDPPSSTESSSTSSTPPSPQQRLVALRKEALKSVDRDGRWVVTLSAKYDGIRDAHQTTSSGSHVFRLRDIVTLHEDLERRHTDDGTTFLITSKDLESTAEGTYADTLWMTMLDPGGLESRDDALAWCEKEFPTLSGDLLLNACYPRQLSAP